MTNTSLDEQQTSRDLPGTGKSVSLLGVPLHFGQSMAGVDLGPGAIRVAGLAERIARLGYAINDRGDLPIERPRSVPRSPGPESLASALVHRKWSAE